ncbi:MAG: hypothetical protein JO316_12715 [Abitibacteriaceae bacterium]|nr:hypothetical protein [Abditibacteriaceae bacterium]MBV9866208.1 hypothetical protein [Abditibacteriaceae bacterium]
MRTTNFMRVNSIRARMTAAFTLSIAALMLLVCGGIVSYLKYSAKHQADAVLQATAQQVQEELKQGKQRLDLDELTEDQNQAPENHIAILMVDPHGHVLQKSQGATPSWPVPHWPMPEADDWRVVTVPSGANTVIVGVPWEKTEHAQRSQALMLLGISLLVIGAAALGSWLLVGHTLSPISSLSRQAQAASTDSLRVCLLEPSPDAEIVELVATLNGLLTRLAATADIKGRFYAAASHELRTPLQALSGHLELAVNRPRTVEEYRAAIEEAHQQTQRLILLVQGLLLLNRLDTATSQPPQEAVNLTEVCDRTLDRFRATIEQRGLRVKTSLADSVEVLAPPPHAEMLVRNLIENAVKYASAGGEVRVALRACDHHAQLEIFDECRIAPDEDIDKYFEPFFRPDSSRNSQTGGNGLGLAICKTIATTNGWQLSLRNNADGILAALQI